MLAWTVAAAVLSLDKAIANPPAAAGDVNVTVPVTGLPPTMSIAFRVSAESAGAVAGAGGFEDDNGEPPDARAADGPIRMVAAARAVATRFRVELMSVAPFVPAGRGFGVQLTSAR